ncbi:MAG: MFS transporter [Anaerolineae bacterium]|nr:MFS transporter [Anaerolineae bacterium]MCA9893509.1 MFS transporter [Anaerolineae bacterium]
MHFPRSRQFWSVALGHMANDIFMSMGAVLLAFLSLSMVPMSNTEIGAAISIQQLAGALSQPIFGALADRRGGRYVGALGLATTASMFFVTILVAVTTHSYLLMLIPFIIQGLGSGAVHPVGMLNANESANGRIASNMAYFFLMGQFGLAMGPTLVGVLLDAANQNALYQVTSTLHLPGLAVAPGSTGLVSVLPLVVIPVIAMMLFSIPIRQPHPRTRPAKRDENSPSISIWKLAAPFIALTILVVLRGLATPGSVNFIPVLFQQKGWSPSEYGAITSVFWVASAISGVVFGNLADRFDRRWVMMSTMVLAAPAFFLLPITDGIVAFGLAVMAGGFVGGAHSIIVVLAQDLIPAGKGFASGSILGFIFATGALGSLIIGSLSDSIGLATTFQIVAIASAASGIMALLIPKHQPTAVTV